MVKNRQNYLYFAEDPVETTNEAIMVPASSYLGCDVGNGSTVFSFESVDGTATAELVTLTHTALKNKQVIQAMVEIINGAHKNNDGYTVVADSELIGTTKAAVFHKAFGGVVTACAIA
jgi:hypothetical protein